MDDLIAFLRAQIYRDEQHALRALCGYPEGRPEVMQSWRRSARWQAGDGRVTIEYIEEPPAMITPRRPVLVHVADRNDCASAHIALHDPARVLAEVDAKRRIIDECAHVIDAHFDAFTAVELAESTLKKLALPYADHPDYRDHWRLAT